MISNSNPAKGRAHIAAAFERGPNLYFTSDRVDLDRAPHTPGGKGGRPAPVRRLLAFSVLILLIACGETASATASDGVRPEDAFARSVTLQTLNGTPVPAASGAGMTVLAFWRTDCGPCLIELRSLATYAKAARPGRFLFVGLQDAAALDAARAKAHAPADDIVRAVGEPADILTQAGGAPPRLPLAIAVSSRGDVCARHVGLLGTDLVRQWVRDCGSAHAGR